MRSSTIDRKNIIIGKVIKINKNNLVVAFNNGLIGSCHISEVSDYLIHDLNDLFEIREFYYFLIIDERECDRYILSYKKIYPKFLKWHYQIIESPSGCTSLKKKLIESL